ncbi:hypothetical protein BO443_270006 [Burkholderia orbicola]
MPQRHGQSAALQHEQSRQLFCPKLRHLCDSKKLNKAAVASLPEVQFHPSDRDASFHLQDFFFQVGPYRTSHDFQGRG